MPKDSAFLPLVVWAQITSSVISLSKTYQATSRSLANCLGKLNAPGRFVDRITSTRGQLEPLITNFEERLHVKFSEGNLEERMMFIFCKGLGSSQFKQNSLDCLTSVLKQELKILDSRSVDQTYIHRSLFMLFLSMTEHEFADLLKEVGLSDVPTTAIGKVNIPTFVFKAVSDGSKQALFSLALAAYIFAGDSDFKYKENFIKFLYDGFRHDMSPVFPIFHIVKKELQNILITSSSITLVNDISSIMTSTFENPDYSEKLSKGRYDEMIEFYEFYDINQICVFKVGKDAETPEVQEVLLFALDVLYRSFCSVIDGRRLERF